MPARILIIEDNAANLALMSYLVEAFGHVSLSAVDGEKGLVIAEREKPDLIVCDIQMPRVDGYGVVSSLKANDTLRTIPIVAVTAFAMVGDRDKVLAAGFNGYIPKPISPETFVTDIEAFLRPGQRSIPSDRHVRKQPTAEPVSQVTKHATILVVDDLEDNLSLKRSMLEPLGYEVAVASNAKQALELARQIEPDLILSDIGMVEGTGFELITAVKTDPLLKDIPFIFITSTYCDEASRTKGLALGAVRFLFRPIEPQVLLAEIESCLRQTKRR